MRQTRTDEKIQALSKQGKFLEIARAEKSDITWKLYNFNLKKGTLKFILNATMDTLPTNQNLLQWGKSPTDKCPFCGNKQTTLHILNNCKPALDQGRYTYRHDSIVNYIAKSLDKTKATFYADIEGFKTETNGTIPPSITITAERPDIVIIDNKNKNLKVFELTVPFETNINERHNQKQEKYQHLITDIEDFKVSIEAFEIGSRGFITTDNANRLKTIHKYCKEGTKFKTFRNKVSALAVNTSYVIFQNRKDKSWNDPPLLLPPFTR